MKPILLSGLALTSLLLVSCAAGDQASVDDAKDEAVAIDPAAADTGPLAEMQGSWASDEDPNRTITIEGSNFQEGYAGDPQYAVPIVFVDSCKTQNRDRQGKAFILHGKEKQACYLLYSVSEKELSYIDGTRGRTSRFTRKE
ncbi:hypothetical protein [Parasphingorhabdus cellanae]|uniref:Lipoprotein n=1 Tax=Parasphingorhabdus cellanae TaxID=2806553 RepID=A0ABX7T618_9SPHN|nr:hypothetical protein [Parasphingorhabdus cellanae]QTD57049.1 hypothetical protein J4G78_05680 [Parasphingorhabdus cellanae]